MPRSAATSVRVALKSLRAGGFVVVEGSEPEAEVVISMSGECVTEASTAFMIRNGTGLIQVPLSQRIANELDLTSVSEGTADRLGDVHTVSVDSVQSTTGASAADRTQTIVDLADRHSQATDFRRPGHVFPVRVRDGGVIAEPTQTEAAVDLVRLAGLRPVAAVSRLMSANGRMLVAGDGSEFGQKFGIPVVAISDVVRFRLENERLMRRGVQAALPTEFGKFTAYGFVNPIDGVEHLALVRQPLKFSRPVLVRIQSECLTGDSFASKRCDCKEQLTDSLIAIAEVGGVVIYLRNQEGRGIGIINKLRAYELQDGGLDTVDANVALGLPIDAREYWMAGHILADLGITKISLLTNNPSKVEQVAATGIDVRSRVGLTSLVTPENRLYLEAKRIKLAHSIAALGADVG